jgi:hypothetical protein
MGTDLVDAEQRSRPTRWFLVFSVPCALLAVAASLWWSYGGESKLALGLTFASWAAAGVFGFVSGLTGEHARLSGIRLVNGVLTALITLGATLGAIAVANFRTDAGREALASPTSPPHSWPALVRAAAETSGNGEVLSVLCDTTSPEAGDVGTCAVSFEGPRCQYWFVGSVDGTDEARADVEGEFFDERGTSDPDLGPSC